MTHTKATTDDVDSVVPAEWGGMWFLKEPLGTEHCGVTILELEPGGKGRAHDHAGDGQEEVYVCVDGTVDVDLGGDPAADDFDAAETVTLRRNEALRVSADEARRLANRGDVRCRCVIAGAPIG